MMAEQFEALNTLRRATPRSLRAAAYTLLKLLSARMGANGPIVVLLLIYAIFWTVTATVRTRSGALHGDMVDEFAVSRALAFGYDKHPPLINWIVAAWFSLMPIKPWAFYLLSCLNAALGMGAVWFAASYVVDTRRRILAVALLGLLPIFTFHAATFNHNTVLLSLWPLVALSFLVSIERRNPAWSFLFGVMSALAILAKYYSFWIVLACALAALLHPNRRIYFRSPRPYLAAATCLAFVAPHLVWLAKVDFVTVTRLSEFLGQSRESIALGSLRYLAAFVAYLLPAVLAVWICLRPSMQSIYEGWPPIRRVVACIAFVPLIFPLILFPFAGLFVHGPWMYPTFFFVPLVIVSAPSLFVSRRAVESVVAGVATFAGLSVILSPLLMIVGFYNARLDRAQPVAAFAEIATDIWHSRTRQSLKLLSGSQFEVWSVSFYSKDHPSVSLNPPSKLTELDNNNGFLGICLLDDTICNLSFAQSVRGAERIVVAVPADFLWMRRPSVSYVLYLKLGRTDKLDTE